MSAASLIQLLSVCIGFIGSVFFAQGVIHQSVEVMARLSASYWDVNPHMHTALASQKADYLFGVVLIGSAFFIQIVSFLVPSEVQALNLQLARWASWVALPITACSFVLLRLVASRVAVNFEKEIVEWLKENP